MKTTVEELERLMTLPSEDEHLEFKKAENQFDTTGCSGTASPSPTKAAAS